MYRVLELNPQLRCFAVKEFDGVRYAELYIPARPAIVLREVKEKPAKSRRKKSST